MSKHIEIKDQNFFTDNLWNELKRFSIGGDEICSVTCTEDNIVNLYNSQFLGKTVYGTIYLYELDEE